MYAANVYKVSFSVSFELNAAHEGDALVLGFSDLVEMISARELSRFGAVVELLEGVEPGEEDDE